MYPPRQRTITLRLAPTQAETLFWEVLGLLSYYENESHVLEADDEKALRLVVVQLEAALKHCESLASHELELLRAITPVEA